MKILKLASVGLLLSSLLFFNQSSAVTHHTKFRIDCLPLLRLVENFSDFLSEDDTESSLFEGTGAFKKRRKRIASLNKFAGLAIYERTWDLFSKKITLDDYLSFLLLTRLNYLELRTDRITQYQGESNFLPPTDPELYDFLMQDKCFSLYEKINRKARDEAQLRYDFLCQLIKNTWDLLKKKGAVSALTQQQLKQLEVSCKLHLFLQDKSLLTGHPDQAGGYGIIKHFIIKHKKEKRLTPKASLLAALEDFSLIHNDEKKYKKHCEKIRDQDIARYFGHLYLVQMPLFYIPLAKASCQLTPVYYDLTLYEHGAWPYPLPYSFRNWLKKELMVLPQVKNIGPVFSHVHKLFAPKKKLPETKVKEEKINSCVLHTSQAPPSPSPSPAPSLPLNLPDQQRVNRPVPTAKACSLPPNPSFNQQKRTTKPLRLTSTCHFEGYGDHLLPRGFRAFHPEMAPRSYERSSKKIGHKQQKIIDCLFDPNRAHTISFRQFSSAFMALGGKIIKGKKGGSHCVLKDSKGNTIGGIFTHGAAQTWGKGYVKYLQTGLLIAGGRPS